MIASLLTLSSATWSNGKLVTRMGRTVIVFRRVGMEKNAVLIWESARNWKVA
ncbi:hypothetical protein BVRB_8g191490 [Beta vulgaris subsp. vulgaris]|nr:hypothetical protein BVRB_8g191490 [Beta vulgaris subsp. vulgaris]